MHDFSSINVAEDPIKIPGQLNEVVPLTPVQIFVKEEQFVRGQLDEVVPLSPVQIFIKEEDAVYCKTEEPELVSLVPLLPKEEHGVDELPEDFEEGSDRLMINLENSSEEWSNQSDPLAIEQNVANASYVEYVETSEPILMELGAASAECSSHSLRQDPAPITQESTTTIETREVYELMGSAKVVAVSGNGQVSPDGDTDGECVEITDMLRLPAKTFCCGYCGEGFPTEGQMQMHTLSHAARTAPWREVPEVQAKPKPARTLKAQHTCGDCSESFERLEHLMRHRLGHIRAALRKPFGVPKLFGSPKPLGSMKSSAVPEPQVSTTPDSRRTAVAVSTRTTPKRSSQRAVSTPQPKRWARRKKARRRRVS